MMNAGPWESSVHPLPSKHSDHDDHKAEYSCDPKGNSIFRLGTAHSGYWRFVTSFARRFIWIVAHTPQFDPSRAPGFHFSPHLALLRRDDGIAVAGAISPLATVRRPTSGKSRNQTDRR